jgi:SpoVK/Ycf46/Vps4 family AAA+-type ATPase
MNENDNVRSILFYGPEGCGKTLMVQAIASEIGAMVINLSSTTIGSSFRTNEEALKLIHMVFTVAKEKSYAPVLIYLDKCHEIFMGKTKRIPQTRGGDGGEGQGEERSRRNAIQASPLDDMNRFQKHLLLYKNTALKKEDRVLIVGITTMPELTDVKLMKWKGSDSGKPEKQGFFEHALYFPLANHSDRMMLWRELMLRRISKINRLELSEITSNPNLDLVALSFMSAGVSGGELSFIVDSILTEDRVNNLAVSPLSEHEFVRYFSRLDKQDDTRFLTFTRQYTNLDSVWKSNNPDGENGDDKRKKKK